MLSVAPGPGAGDVRDHQMMGETTPVAWNPAPATTAAAAAGCPVCHRRVERQDVTCPRCGWQLRGDYVLGEVTAELRRAFDERLTRARRRRDLRAVARVLAALEHTALEHADPDLPARLAALVHGGPPSAAALAAERAALAAERAARGAERAAIATSTGPVGASGRPSAPELAVVLSSLLRRMGPGEAGRITVVELQPDAVVVSSLAPGPGGVPGRPVATRAWDWSELLPALPADRDARRLSLAGGLGDDIRPASLAPVLAAVDGTRAAEILLVRPAVDWPMISQAGNALADSLRRADNPRRADGRRGADGHERRQADNQRRAGGGPGVHQARARRGESLVVAFDTALRRVPLAVSYGLVVAEVDQATRQVRLRTRDLFHPGAVATGGQPPTAEVTVTAPGFAPAELALAIVAGGPVSAHTDSDPYRWAPIALGWAAVAPGTELRLRLALDGPGRVRFLEPDGIRVDNPGSGWPELLAGLPRYYGASPVDVVCLVETAGTAQAVAPRLRLVEDLLALVEAEHADPESLRFTVLGFDDHDFLGRSRRGREPTVRAAGPGTVTRVRAVLRDWRPSAPQHDFAAALEDALAAAARLPWRRGAAAALVTIGARPPHPPRQEADDLTLPCLVRHDWRRIMDDLVAERGPRRVAVRGELSTDLAQAGAAVPARAGTAWNVLGADALLRLGTASARQVAEALGVLAGPAGRPLPLPLCTDAASSAAGAAGPAAGAATGGVW
ncbi:hypothetical protein [Parafrankia discariae]|uniref:hypothetical protein n=1 Tax=Parafrankia discariae TaxID=365528 RepID=UPI0003675CCB|nr:hypothetical protein [Parafrankia discariae]